MDRKKLRLYFPTLVLASLLAMGATKCARIPLDPSAKAAESHDETVQFQGAGAVSRKGYLFVQKREATPLDDVVSVIVPKLTCKRDSCAKVQFFRKDGTPGVSVGIPRDQTTQAIPISDIVGHAGPVAFDDDGEYSAIVQLIYVGADGGEYGVLMNGFVRLNVLSKAYSPVGCNDPTIGWRVTTGDKCVAQFTTAGRTASCGTGCESAQ